MIDFALLQREKGSPSPRMLDVACGTGIWLQCLLERIPSLQAYGVDGSEEMLAQARLALKQYPGVVFARGDLNGGEWAQAFLALEPFALITATNVLHDLSDPARFLAELRVLLEPGGQLMLIDFAPHRPLWLWKAFEMVLQRVEQTPVRALSISEAILACKQAGFRLLDYKTFVVNWLWHGWALHLTRGT